MKKDKYIDKAIEWAKSRIAQTIRVNSEGYDEPKSFVNQTKDKVVMPDLTYTTRGGSKHYSEIALKTDKAQDLVTKWKFLSQLAQMKSGKLHLLAPKGHLMFTRNLVKKYNIEAQVHSLK
ncbi:MAG: hypothetical protein R3275_00405 [Saprospiraceae bacterium]|nr:hypothetical protein [Saprospiraceae bacterium]